MVRVLKLFIAAVLVGVIGTAGTLWATFERPFAGVWLDDTVAVREQMTPADVAEAKSRNYTAIVDLRPDGEAAGQPSSSEMAEVARRQGMAFHYIPVPHGPIPDKAAEELAAALAQSKGPVLMYCRSGARAARAWALVEASRSKGMDAQTIVDRVRTAGYSVDDMKAALEARIAARGKK